MAAKKIKQYFVFRLCWSQTDQSTVIVEADSEASARKKILANPVRIDIVCSSETLIT